MRKRSHYRPRPVIKPLGIKDEAALELHTRISALALDTDWIEMQHLRDIGAHALLCELVADTVGDQDKSAESRSIASICVYAEDRYERHGMAEVTASEMKRLRECLAETIPWLSQQPNMSIYRASERLVRKHDRLRDAARRQVAA